MKKFIYLLVTLVFISLNTFSQTNDTINLGNTPPVIQPQVDVEDRELFQDYIDYCKFKVLDTVQVVGWININPDTLVTDTSTVLMKYAEVDGCTYDNNLRKRKFKNVPPANPPIPTLGSDKKPYWITIVYPCYRRKATYDDFYGWYYNLPTKPS